MPVKASTDFFVLYANNLHNNLVDIHIIDYFLVVVNTIKIIFVLIYTQKNIIIFLQGGDFMELKDRLKVLRKHFKKTQIEFGSDLGCGRDTIANYEGGRVVPSDTFLQLICAKFPINENWLRNGQGDMILADEDQLFINFAKQYDLSEAEQNVAKYLLAIPSTERQKLMEHIVGLATAITNAQEISNKKTPAELDAETAAFRQELEKMEQYKTKTDDTHSAV